MAKMKAAYFPPTRTPASIQCALYTLVPFSGFYTVKFGTSPIYLTFILGVTALFISSLEGIRLRRETPSLVAAALLLAYITTFAYHWTFDSALPSAWINLAFSLVYFIATTVVLENCAQSDARRATELAIAFSTILLSLELVYRFTHPAEPEDWTSFREEIFWYEYKTSSFMYPDSNSVGLFVACLLAFIHGLPTADARGLKKYSIPLIVLLLASLSRAAIVATTFVFIYSYLRGIRGRMLLILMIAGVIGVFTYSFIAADESLLSKFWIAGLVADHLNSTDAFTLMTGVGPGNAERVLGVGAHLLPFTLAIEIGMTGTALTIILWICIWVRAGKHATPIFIALLLNGLSFTTFAIPWFYSMAAVLIYFSRIAPSDRLSPHSRLQR